MLDAELNQSFVNNSLPQPVVPRARFRMRHAGLLLSFVLLVVVPIAVSAWYLTQRAADQYASRVGFSVQKQSIEAPVDLLGGLGALGGNTSLDSDILYEFIQSQDMVERVDAALGLRAMFSKPVTDPVFAFDPAAPIEDLVQYWQQMVSVTYDRGTGLIELRARAFAPADAIAIAQETLAQSSLLVNRLTTGAREDATRYARLELDEAVLRLKQARGALTQFRVQENIVDPSADAQAQVSLLGSMQQQLAETLIELDLLLENTRDGDTRVANLRRRADVIRNRIAKERDKFGNGSDGSAAISTLIAEFETLSVDLEFAQTAYLSALRGYDAALRHAQQQSRYLAAYLNPTRPQSAEFPQTRMLLGLIALFSFLIWALLALTYYSARDRA